MGGEWPLRLQLPLPELLLVLPSSRSAQPSAPNLRQQPTMQNSISPVSPCFRPHEKLMGQVLVPASHRVSLEGSDLRLSLPGHGGGTKSAAVAELRRG